MSKKWKKISLGLGGALLSTSLVAIATTSCDPGIGSEIKNDVIESITLAASSNAELNNLKSKIDTVNGKDNSLEPLSDNLDRITLCSLIELDDGKFTFHIKPWKPFDIKIKADKKSDIVFDKKTTLYKKMTYFGINSIINGTKTDNGYINSSIVLSYLTLTKDEVTKMDKIYNINGSSTEDDMRNAAKETKKLGKTGKVTFDKTFRITIKIVE